LTTAPHGIRPEQIDSADCIAAVPGFKKGAAVVGVGFGRGFISCRTDAGWSAPGAIAFETGSLGVRLGAQEIDIVILSMDRSRRPKLLSDRFAVGSDAAAAWGNGKAPMEIPMHRSSFLAAPRERLRVSALMVQPLNGTNPATRPFMESQSQTR